MNKIQIVARREFSTRIRKKSFLIITLLVPFLLFITLSSYNLVADETESFPQTIAVLDDSYIFTNQFKNTSNLKFEFVEGDMKDMKALFPHPKYDAVVYIPSSIINKLQASIYSTQQVSNNISNYIALQIKQIMEMEKLKSYDIENLPQILKSITSDIHIISVKWDNNGDKQAINKTMPTFVGYSGGLLIYVFIMLYSSMLMKSVVEEKSNRIVEILLSCVKPFQLMMGKIIGIAFVGLAQFFSGGIIILILLFCSQTKTVEEYGTNTRNEIVNSQKMTGEISKLSNDGGSILLDTSRYTNLFSIIIGFIFYFIFGYFLYSSIFAAVGSMADTETDTQQFIFPITLPLILSIMLLFFTIEHPNSILSVVFSMIPFTSPIIMMGRIPFGIPVWQVVSSISILILSFIIFTYLSSKIYKAAILTYGNKFSIRNMARILFRK